MSHLICAGDIVSWRFQSREMAGVVVTFMNVDGVINAVVDPLQSMYRITKPARDLTPFRANTAGGRS